MKKKYNIIESYSLNENAQTHDLIETLPSCTPDNLIPNASIDPSEVVINATLCAQPVDVKEVLFREISFLKIKVTSYEQQMDHVMSNFGNINYKTELEMKVSLLEKENFELIN